MHKIILERAENLLDYSIMPYEEILDYIKRGWEFEFSLDDKIILTILTKSEKSIFIYSYLANGEDIEICNKYINKSEIYKEEIYDSLTLKELYKTNRIKLINSFC